MKIKNKKGFALVYAILVMILVATIGMHTLYLINKTQSTAINEHIKTQMDLYMSSSIEYSLLWLSENQANSTGVNNLTINYPGNYVFNIRATAINVPANIPESQGTVILDITGSYNDNKHKFIVTKRTIQKP